MSRAPSTRSLPTALQDDKADPAQGRVAILDALADLRKKAQERFGLSGFGRSCEEDTMLEAPEEMLKERYCFPAGQNLKGYDCCAVQRSFRAADPGPAEGPRDAFALGHLGHASSSCRSRRSSS